MQRLFIIIITIIMIGCAIYFGVVYMKPRSIASPAEPATVEITQDHISYKNSEYGPEFVYPAVWGSVNLKPGNSACPEDDTYRTIDTLNIFEWEYSFDEFRLPGSDSMVRTGVRLHELDPQNLNDCGDEFYQAIINEKIDPRTISSVRLIPITTAQNLLGMYNSQASRLDTEARTQYTLFIPNGPTTYILQIYTSFVPHFGSPELAEIEGRFNNDIIRYIQDGVTAKPIRQRLRELQTMVESLKFNSEF